MKNINKGGSPPYGFKVVHKSETIAGKLVIHKTLEPDPAEQAIIKIMQNHRRAGKSYYEIATWINGQGYKTKHGKDWTTVQVNRILERKNEVK
jgi:hypothetical protein